MRASFFVAAMGLMCAPAAGQFLAGDILVSHFEPGGGSVIHMRADGSVEQVINAPPGSEWTGLATTADGLLLMRRSTPVTGIDVVDADGIVIDGFNTPGVTNFPADVEVLGDGSVVLADQSGFIQIFDRQGLQTGLLVTPGMQAVGMSVALDQRLWCGSPSAFFLLGVDPYGGPLTFLNSPTPTIDLIAAPDDTLWTIDPTSGVVRQCTNLGELLIEFPTQAVGAVSAFALASNGDVLVAGNNESIIRRYGQDGSARGVFGLPNVEGWPMFMHVVDPFSVGVDWCSAQPVNSTGVPARLQALGSGVAGETHALLATNLPPLQSGYLVTSQAKGIIPFAGGSQGHLCVVGSVGRFLDQLQGSGLAGVIISDVDTTALPLTEGTTAAVAGETWYFQLWYRDFNPGPTSNFTSMVQLTFD